MTCMAHLEASSGVRPLASGSRPTAQPFQASRPSKRSQHRDACTRQAGRAIRAQAAGDAVAAVAPAAPPASPAAPASPLVYAGVAFDMDGELWWGGAGAWCLQAPQEQAYGDALLTPALAPLCRHAHGQQH